MSTLVVDVRTGLPSLLKGEFWVVRKGVYGRRGDWIECRRRRLFFGSKLLGWATIDDSKFQIASKKNTVYAAHTVLQRIKDRSEAANIYGKYPPKCL